MQSCNFGALHQPDWAHSPGPAWPPYIRGCGQVSALKNYTHTPYLGDLGGRPALLQVGSNGITPNTYPVPLTGHAGGRNYCVISPNWNWNWNWNWVSASAARPGHISPSSIHQPSRPTTVARRIPTLRGGLPRSTTNLDNLDNLGATRPLAETISLGKTGRGRPSGPTCRCRPCQN